MVASASAEARTAPHFRSDVQGLRAVAVLLVLAYHAGIPWLGGGYVGVDVFFVISGYLITAHLVREITAEGRLDLMAFYARRARRILPAALIVLAVSAVAAFLVVPPVEREGVLKDATASALYVPNMLFAARETDYLAEGSPSIFQHYWSLGVEEQFYLLWPVALLLIVRRWGRTRAGTAVAVAGLVTLSFVACLAVMQVSESWAFFALPTRAWELGVGALVAVVASRGLRVSGAPAAVLTSAGLVMILAAGLLFTDATTFPGVAALLPVLGAALVVLCDEDARTPATRLLQQRPMLFVGAISYSLYLVHWPLILIPQAAAGDEVPLPTWATVALAALSVPVAYLCYLFVEQPFRRKRAGSTHRRTVAVSLAASAALGAATVTSAVAVSRAPIHAGQEAPSYRLEPNPSGTPYVPANLTPDLRTAPDDNPEIYANGCVRSDNETDGSGCLESADEKAPRVVLFGDSHAANWHPALAAIAEDGEIQLDVNAKSSCQSATIESDATEYPECHQWRQNVIDRLNEDPPELIVLANYATLHAADAEDSEAYWQEALQQTIDALPAESRIAIVADTPTLPAVPSRCLSRHVEDAERCAASVEEGLDEATRRAEETIVAEHDRVDRIDLTSYFCNDRICPVVIGDQLAYRDSHHLTRTFSQSLEPLVREELAGLVEGLEPQQQTAAG